MNELTPMKLHDKSFSFENPSFYRVHNAEYNDYTFCIKFEPMSGLFIDIVNSEERYNIVKNKYKDDIELRDFTPILSLYYSPITMYNRSEKIELELNFLNKDGKCYLDYICIFDEDDELDINIDGEEMYEEMCKFANVLYLGKTGMTCYETMLEDDDFDLLEENKYEVRSLKRMSRQALDKLREIKMNSKEE